MSDPSILYPQAFLVYEKAYKRNEDKIKKSDLKKSPYVKVAKLIGNYKTEAVMSKIFGSLDTKQNKSERDFLNMQTHKLSALVPEIRLFKIIKEGQDKKSVPFYFPITADFKTDPQGIIDISTRSFSAGGAVIQSFSYSFQGKSPYSLTRRFLKANLTIKVDNIEILFERKSGYAILADLFTIGSGNRNEQVSGFQRSLPASRLASLQSARIGATIGYSVPLDGNLFTSAEITSIESSKQMLNLTYSTHDITLSEDGSATVSVSYTGHLESFQNASQFDLLSGAAAKASMEVRKTKHQKTAGKINKFFGSRQKQSAGNKPSKKDIQRKKQEDIREAFAEIIGDLYANKKIHKISFHEDYFKAITTSEFLSLSEAEREKQSQQASKKQEEKGPKNQNPFSDFNQQMISYFTFGDFLQSYFKKIGDDLKKAKGKTKTATQGQPDGDKADQASGNLDQYIKALQEINVLLASVTATQNKMDDNGANFVLNIADIPISIDTFYTMVYKEIRQPGLGFYDMYSFLEGFAKDLLQKSFDDFPAAKFIKPTTFSVVTYTSSALRSAISKGEINISKMASPNQLFSRASIEESEEYIVFVQEPAEHSKPVGSGNQKKDDSEGIFHLSLSKDRGLVKSISFSKISSPSREAALVAVNADMYDELRLPHNASVSMVGNFMFMPLCQVYVDPNSIGFGSPKDLNSSARRLGFGGYYTVTDVTTSLNGGKLDTKLSLNFVCFPETASEPDLPFGTIDSINSVSNIGGG